MSAAQRNADRHTINQRNEEFESLPADILIEVVLFFCIAVLATVKVGRAPAVVPGDKLSVIFRNFRFIYILRLSMYELLFRSGIKPAPT